MWLDILKGAGAILGAGATYYTGKEANKIEKKKLDYQIEQDKLVEDKVNQTQANLDTALENVYGTNKKKKSSTTTAGVDLSLAYGTPSTEM